MKRIITLIIISIILLTGCSVKESKKIKDNEKFAKEYDVSVDNPFVYANIDEILKIFENGSGIIYFGTSDCEWCRGSASILTNALKKEKVKVAYYYNPTKIQNDNTKEYKKLLKLLDDYLEKDEEGNKTILLPDIYVVKNGKIIDHNNDLAKNIDADKEYFTDNQKKKLINKYLKLLDNYDV